LLLAGDAQAQSATLSGSGTAARSGAAQDSADALATFR
jgi:hypothetical protein